MPETKKYLNRDGLEEYNSLLPHSSSEIQEYVDNWLDAHPEATTTVQDGSITMQKLADGSVTRNKLAADVAHLLGGMMVTGKVQDEILTADDAYSVAPLSITIDGKSTQNGTPTPDAPVPIESIEALNLPVTFAGKNLFDQSQITASTSAAFLTIQLAPGLTYTASSSKPSGSGGFDIQAAGTSLSVNTAVYANHPVTFTTDANGTGKISIRYYNGSGNPLSAYSYQIETGTVATAYAPYVAPTTAQIPMQGHVLRSLPDGTCDNMQLSYLRESERAGWAWYSRKLVQRVHQATFDDSDSWSRNVGTENADGTWRFGLLLVTSGQPNTTWNSVNKPVPAFCDQLAAAKTSELYYDGPDHFGMYQNRLYVRMSGITTLDELKAWLAEHPLTVLYPITPTTTTLDPIELPVLPTPNCTVWSDPSTGLQMEYVRDSNIVIQRIEEAIADL